MNNLPSQGPVSLGAIQSFHSDLDAAKGFDRDPVRNVAYLVEELGEVARAVRRLQATTDADERSQLSSDLAEELADCLAYLAKLANYANIDLESSYLRKMEQNLARKWH